MEVRINTEYEVLTPNGFKPFYGVKKNTNKYLTITLNTGEKIGVTHKHIFVVNDINIYADELKIGDKLCGFEIDLEIIKIDEVNDFTDVYDLIEVEGGNIYYTNNILSHNCAFIGSGDNVIDGEAIQKQESENVMDAIFKDPDWGGGAWVFKYPILGHRYILACDVSRGDSEDATGITIIDFDTNEMVFEYHGKVPPDIAAEIVFRYGTMYNALSTFDITGGMGIVTINKLKALAYPQKLFHYDVDGTDLYHTSVTDSTIPGINFASKNRRTQIVSALETGVVRLDFKVRSNRCTAEMKRFIYKNGKADHMRGSHDDLLMSLGMCLFVGEKSFKQLQAANDLTKAMLDSWKVRTTTVPTKANTLLKDITSSPNQTKTYKHQNEEILRNTRDFSWLFGTINNNK